MEIRKVNPPGFKPYKLIIAIENEGEHEALKAISWRTPSIPEMIYPVITPTNREKRSTISILLTAIFNAIEEQ